MKRISRSILLILITAIIPLSMALGQDKKKEAKIKVVVAGKDGTETVTDTTFTGDNMPDSIVLDNGKVVLLKDFGKKMTIVSEGKDKGSIYITTTISDDDENATGEKVIVISGHKGEWTAKPSTGTVSHVYAYADDSDKCGKTEKHIVIKSAGDGEIIRDDEGVDKVIIVKDCKAVKADEGDKVIHVTVDSDADTETEMTKYVIAKDGVVVTVECNDEAKAKEIIKEIETKLDTKAGSAKQETVKPETKKAGKK